MELFEARFPVAERSLRYGQAGRDDLTGSARAAPRARPWEKSYRSPGSAGAITEIQMVTSGIIEIHRPFHEAQSEYASVEVDVRLRIGCDGGDVVNPAQFHENSDACISGES